MKEGCQHGDVYYPKRCSECELETLRAENHDLKILVETTLEVTKRYREALEKYADESRWSDDYLDLGSHALEEEYKTVFDTGEMVPRPEIDEYNHYRPGWFIAREALEGR